MINYYDDFLESHIAQLIDMQMKEVSWKYDYDSKPNGTQKHWHAFCGHNMDECNQNGYEFIVPIWEKIKNVVNVELERVYLNAHTFGIEPHIHTDDGDITDAEYQVNEPVVFSSFAFKIVLISNNSSKPPMVSNFRSIATT